MPRTEWIPTQHTLDERGTLCSASHCQHCDACGTFQELLIEMGGDRRGAWLHVHCYTCAEDNRGHELGDAP